MRSERRSDPRSLPTNYQERRRAAALEQQQRARDLKRTSHRKTSSTNAHSEPQQLRQPLDPSELPLPPAEDDITPAAPSVRQHWASQMMQPEWLVEIPSNLASEWYVLPRPEGQRCLVVATKGHTVARLRNGIVADSFQSGLPSGGPGSRGGEECILDCIYHPTNSTYYVLDVLCWRSHELLDCTTEFRFYWMHTKLTEDMNPNPIQIAGKETAMETQSSTAPPQERHFVPLPSYPATPGGIHAAYTDPVEFIRDGIYLVHRRASYSPGQTPLALTWKDAASSRYFIDTDAAGVQLPEQQVVLYYKAENRTVYTADEPPVVLGVMPESFVREMGGKLKDGRLLRFAIGTGGVQFVDGQPVGADLKFLGAANQRRGRADTLSKLLFQLLARTSPITIDALLAAAAASEAAGPGVPVGIEVESIGLQGVVGKGDNDIIQSAMQQD